MDLESELRIYQQFDVKWVVFYDIPSRGEVNLVHQYGMSALVYQNALAAEYTDLRRRGYDDDTIKDWAQKNIAGGYYYINTPTSKNATDDGYNSVRISPYGGYPSSGYLDAILLPQIRTIVRSTERNADGVFLDVLFLKSNTDGNPGFMARYSEWLQTNQKPDTPENFQEFRYYSIHDVAKRIYDTVKISKSSAVLIISNNNIFNHEDREAYALDISRLQDVSDILMHEHGDLDQVAPEGTIYRLRQERGDGYPLQGAQPVTKPLWIHYLTNQTQRFQTMLTYMDTYDFGYWGYNQYFWTHTASGGDQSGISASPAVRWIGQGQTTTYRVTVGSAVGSSVFLTLSGLPDQAEYTFSPSTVAPSQESTLTISTNPSVEKGIYILTIIGGIGYSTISTTARLGIGGVTTHHLTYGGTEYSVTILTNSIVSDFTFDQARRLVNYSVAGFSGTEGFCNITVPKPILDGEPVVFMDNSEVHSSSTSINATHYLIHFTYTHSTHTVTIGGSYTIPELPAAHIGAVAFAVLTFFLAITRKRKPETRLAKKS